jgi:hypothetical protein
LTLTPQQRAHNYSKEFAKYPASHSLMTEDRWISAQWLLGNNYKSSAKNDDGTPFYGAYQPEYLKRIMALFPDAPRALHLFAGSLPPSEGWGRPDGQGDAGAGRVKRPRPRGDAQHYRAASMPNELARSIHGECQDLEHVQL